MGFTCYKQNGSSTVDYMIVNLTLLPTVKTFTVNPMLHLSYHAFLHLTLNVSPRCLQQNCQNNTILRQSFKKYRWIQSSYDDFPMALLEPEVSRMQVNFL